MNKNLSIVREACVRANPVQLQPNGKCVYCGKNLCICPWRLRDGSIDKKNLRPIRLADVLFAINEFSQFTDLYFVTQAGAFGKYVNLGGARGHKIEATAYLWNLREDDLAKQSESTLQFLADLLQEK